MSGGQLEANTFLENIIITDMPAPSYGLDKGECKVTLHHHTPLQTIAWGESLVEPFRALCI